MHVLPKAVSLISLLALAACASVPPSTTVTPRQASDLQSTQSLAGSHGQWPANEWWQGFNDPQLNVLMAEAFAGSPDLAAAQARIQKAQALSDQVHAATQADASLNITDSETKQSYNMGTPDALSFGGATFNPKDILPHGYQNLTRISVDANYDLDLWGKSRAATRGAIGNLNASRIEGEVVRQNIATNLVNAYVELNRLYETRDELAELKQGSNLKIQLYQARAEHNLDPKDVLLGAQDEAAQIDQRIAATDGAIRVQNDLIAALVGAGPDRGLSIARPQLAPADIGVLPDDVSLNLLGRRADVEAARLHVEAQAQNIKYTRADYYPDVKLSAYWGVEALSRGGFDQLFRSGSDIGGIGPAFTLPLFHQGRLNAAYHSAEADYNAAVATYDQTLVTAFQQVADAASATRSTAGEVAAAQARFDAAQQTYELTKARNARGLNTKIDVLTAHLRVVTAQSTLTDLKAQQYRDRIRFIAALGGGFQAQ